MNPIYDFNGQVALVIGAAKGMGLAKAQMFAQSGYQGYVSAEYEGEEDPMTGVPKLVERIKALSRKYSSAG